jgi:hypothetical protein
MLCASEPLMSMHLPSVVIAAVLSAASTAAAVPVPAVCQPAVDAQVKVITTPHHTVTTQGNQPKTGEAITVDGVNYVKIRDNWIKSPMSPQEVLKQEQENIKNASAYSCTKLADDSVDGAATSVYKVHSEMPEVGSADAQIWVSKATGLPLRTEEDFKEFNTTTPRHMSIKYDYTNIKAPAVK